MGFLSSKEVAVPQWGRRVDNEIVDSSGQLETAYIDVTIRAIHQQNLKTRNAVVQKAVKDKMHAMPSRDEHGRRVICATVVPFVMTSMGSIDKHAHGFLRTCRARNPDRAEHMMNLISVQHAKWIAHRLRRCLGFQNATLSDPKPYPTFVATGNRGKFHRFEAALKMSDDKAPAQEMSCQSQHRL